MLKCPLGSQNACLSALLRAKTRAKVPSWELKCVLHSHLLLTQNGCCFCSPHLCRFLWAANASPLLPSPRGSDRRRQVTVLRCGNPCRIVVFNVDQRTNERLSGRSSSFVDASQCAASSTICITAHDTPSSKSLLYSESSLTIRLQQPSK